MSVPYGGACVPACGPSFAAAIGDITRHTLDMIYLKYKLFSIGAPAGIQCPSDVVQSRLRMMAFGLEHPCGTPEEECTAQDNACVYSLYPEFIRRGVRNTLAIRGPRRYCSPHYNHPTDEDITNTYAECDAVDVGEYIQIKHDGVGTDYYMRKYVYADGKVIYIGEWFDVTKDAIDDICFVCFI